jgi:hypothetical protein
MTDMGQIQPDRHPQPSAGSHERLDYKAVARCETNLVRNDGQEVRAGADSQDFWGFHSPTMALDTYLSPGNGGRGVDK